jgi:imidazoleglycerol phosphate synthase glutamine amidotransferase subunit HisH
MGEVRYGNLTLMHTTTRFRTLGGRYAVYSRVSARVSYQRNWHRNRNTKSLVLPGVGAFANVDGKKVTKEDIGRKLVKSFVRNSDSISHRHNVSMV